MNHLVGGKYVNYSRLCSRFRLVVKVEFTRLELMRGDYVRRAQVCDVIEPLSGWPGHDRYLAMLG